MYGLFGKVTKCFQEKGYAFIYGEDNNSYFLHYSKLNGEKIQMGDYVFFVPFKNDKSDYNAKNISVIYTPDKEIQRKANTHKKNQGRKHKSCNADKIIRDDKKFKRFVRDFMHENKAERGNNG